jgi:hypothetical protein
MKKTIISILVLQTVPFSKLVAQGADDCGTTSPGQGVDVTQHGGIYVPAGDIFKVLVVFARFRDDVTPTRIGLWAEIHKTTPHSLIRMRTQTLLTI